jgi:type I restriction enzyme S subunit
MPLDASPRFVGWFLNSDVAKVQYALGSEGALQLHFNVETSKEVTIPLPPHDEQEAVAAHIDVSLISEDHQAAKVQRSVDLLAEYRSTLIAAAVTGKLELS